MDRGLGQVAARLLGIEEVTVGTLGVSLVLAEIAKVVWVADLVKRQSRDGPSQSNVKNSGCDARVTP